MVIKELCAGVICLLFTKGFVNFDFKLTVFADKANSLTAEFIQLGELCNLWLISCFDQSERLRVVT